MIRINNEELNSKSINDDGTISVNGKNHKYSLYGAKIGRKYSSEACTINTSRDGEYIDMSIVQNIKSLNILVIGAGGTGSSVIDSLVNRGVKSLTIVDHDTIEVNNVSRLNPFSKNKICQNKVDVYSSFDNINPIVDRVENIDENIFNNIDLIITCTDNIKSRQYIDKVRKAKKIPWIDGGVGVTYTEKGYYMESTVSYFGDETVGAAPTNENGDYDFIINYQLKELNMISAAQIMFLIDRALGIIGGDGHALQTAYWSTENL